MPKFIICLGLYLSFSEVQASDLFKLAEEDQGQTERIYLELSNRAKEKKRPLISLMADKPTPILKELIKKGSAENDFTALDAKWAIDKSSAGQTEYLDDMLLHGEFEYTLTENYNDSCNLLAYCLYQGFNAEMAKILKRFPRLSANREVKMFESLIKIPFEKAQSKFKKDQSIPLLGLLMMDSDSSSYEAYIAHGMRTKVFTSRDLLWITEEFSNPKKLSKEFSSMVFHFIFSMPLPTEEKPYLNQLVTNVDLPKETSAVSGTKEWLHGHSHSEMQNLLAVCVENGYFEAFKSILGAFKDLPIYSAAVKRKEYASKVGWFSSAYQDTSYNLITWLMRGRGNNQPGTYLKKGSIKPHYHEAGQIIKEIFFREYYDPDDPTWEVDPGLFDMLRYLTTEEDWNILTTHELKKED